MQQASYQVDNSEDKIPTRGGFPYYKRKRSLIIESITTIPSLEARKNCPSFATLSLQIEGEGASIEY
jgi:hypothetical protein